MATVYSTYEAKTRFSELLRKVRGGEKEQTFEERLDRLEAEGLLVPPKHPPETKMQPVARRAAALKRFLEARD